MSQKGSANIALIILGLLVLGAAVYFAFGTKVQAPQSGEIVQQNNESTSTLIEILIPKAGELIPSPLVVGGIANAGWTVFEGVAGTMTLYDDNNSNLGQAQLMADTDWTKPPVHFTATLDFSPPSTNSGRLDFSSDNPSGDPVRQQHFTMPVKFASVTAQTKKIELFYYNKTKDADSSCSRDAVLPVEREIPISMTPIQDTVNLLLKGNLSDVDKLAGFQTEFPLSGFSLTGANLKNGILTLQFNDSQNRSGGGSCRVMLLWAQISKTALQFPEVKQVRFQPETLFQP
ncbi:MAG: GerMN domain-containing protein [Minisyncoccia bacterium]|jgi:hypothetical protein